MALLRAMAYRVSSSRSRPVARDRIDGQTPLDRQVRQVGLDDLRRGRVGDG
jgi:hypothetical protein